MPKDKDVDSVGKDTPKTTSKNPGTDKVQLAPENHHLSSTVTDTLDGYTSHNFVLLTPMKIGLNQSPQKTGSSPPQQHDPSCLQGSFLYNPLPKPSPLQVSTLTSPNLESPKHQTHSITQTKVINLT